MVARQLVLLACVAGALAAIASANAPPAVATVIAAQQDGERPPVLVVAHRGASAHAPEHTGPAYDEAVRAGADVLECDLQLTEDEQLVCVHDTTIDRTTGGDHTGRVDSYTLAELRDMDFGSWFGDEFAGARIVTLEEQLTCYRGADPTLQFYLETKAPAEYGGRMEPLLVDLLERLDLVPEGEPDVRTSPVIVQSFDINSLAAVRRLAPSLPLAFLTVAPSASLPDGAPDVEVLAAAADSLTASPEVIAAHHDADREVHTWTVDDPDQMDTLIEAGVDGFFTNDPATGREVVDGAGRGSGRTSFTGVDSDARPEACAEGLGFGIGTATPTPTTEGTEGPDDDDAAPSDPSAANNDDGDGVSPAVIAIGAGLLALAAVAATVMVRRRTAAEPNAE